jgi:hypothetical protein
VFGHGFYLAETLEGSVVSLVQFPGFDERDMEGIEFFCSIVEGLDGSFEAGSEADIEGESSFLEYFACSPGLLDS